MDAKNWLSGLLSGDKTKLKKILAAGETVSDNAAEVENPSDTSKLTGELVIEGYPNLESIDLSGNEITGLTIVKCPKLKIITIRKNKLKFLDLLKTNVDGGNEGIGNDITELYAGHNELERIEIRNCEKLEKLFIPDNPGLKKIKGSTAHINEITITNTPAEFVTSDDLKELKDTKDAVKVLLGDGAKSKLPIKPGGGVDTDQLKKDLEGKLVGKNIDGAALGLTGSDATNIDKIKEKLRDLAQQTTQAVNNLLNEINSSSGLGLTGTNGTNITKEQIINKIKELIAGGPSCTHTDYNAIKGELNDYKSGSLKKGDIVEGDKEFFGKLGIAYDDYKSETVSISASEVGKLKNKLIEKRFGELTSQNNTSFYLNIALSVLVIGSLAAIIYLLLRENKSKTEPEPEEKEPAKIKKF